MERTVADTGSGTRQQPSAQCGCCCRPHLRRCPTPPSRCASGTRTAGRQRSQSPAGVHDVLCVQALKHVHHTHFSPRLHVRLCLHGASQGASCTSLLCANSSAASHLDGHEDNEGDDDAQDDDLGPVRQHKAYQALAEQQQVLLTRARWLRGGQRAVHNVERRQCSAASPLGQLSTGIARSAHGSTHHLCTLHTCMSGVMPSSLSAELTSRACSEYSPASVLIVSLCREGLLPLKGPPAAVAAAGGSAAAACWGCTKRPSARGISISGELTAAARRGLAGLGVPCIGQGLAVPRAERPPVAAGAWALR